jgi:hypothetical protein
MQPNILKKNFNAYFLASYKTRINHLHKCYITYEICYIIHTFKRSDGRFKEIILILFY